MYKIVILCIGLSVIFSSCTPTQLENTPSTLTNKKTSKHKKTFEEEDTLIMFALRTEALRDYDSASKIFDTLYIKSKKKEYLYRSLQNKLFIKANEDVIQRVEHVTDGETEDFVLGRLKVVALMQEQRYEESEKLALELVANSASVENYMLASDIYIAKQKYDLALKYLESAYAQNYSETVLDRMSIILYVNLKRKKDAIAYLETHTRAHGCSILICKRLIGIYSNEDNIDGLLSAYLRYYKLEQNAEIAKQIVQLYGYKKEYNKLMLFLQSSGADNKTLLQLYLSTKNYEKAFPLAYTIYKDTGDVKYLGESVIYEFEYKSKENKDDKTFLQSISQRFEKLIAEDDDSIYLNYYGYILIDYEIDVKKGMSYVYKALEQEPNSSYYLDSIAWGHYKLQECTKAMDVIQKVMRLEGGDDPEVLLHYELIKKCKGKK